MTDEAKGSAGDWITVREAQKVIGGKRTVTTRTVRRWIARHKITTHRQYRDGGYTLLLARQEVEALTDPDKALGNVRASMSELVKVTDLDKWTKNVRDQLDIALKAQAEHNRRQEASRRRLRWAVVCVAVLSVAGIVAVWRTMDKRAANIEEGLYGIMVDQKLLRYVDSKEQEHAKELEAVRAELAEVKAALRPSGPPPPAQAGRPSPVSRGARRWWELWRD